MKALGAFAAFSLTVATARWAAAQAAPAGAPPLSVIASASATPPAVVAPSPAAVPPAVPPPNTLSDVTDQAADGEYDPNMYADSVDTDVAYDDQVAQSYDDGYDPQAYAQFADALSPYGTWIDDSAYGRVWMPSSSIVGADFSSILSCAVQRWSRPTHVTPGRANGFVLPKARAVGHDPPVKGHGRCFWF